MGQHDGDPFIPVSAATRDAAGISSGDALSIEVSVDTEPIVVDVPPDLAAALDAEPDARAFFESLTPSQQKGFAQPVTSAKKPRPASGASPGPWRLCARVRSVPDRPWGPV